MYQAEALTPITQPDAAFKFTEEDLDYAHIHMARHKAKGGDQLQDHKFLDPLVWNNIKGKVLMSFNEMI